MFFSVIIPIFNGARHLDTLLPALAGQTYKNAEFIFVDNGSQDRSPDIINNFVKHQTNLKAKILHEARRGASIARNTGARNAGGEWLVFTDADCRPEADWLQDFYDMRSVAANVGAIAGCIKPSATASLVAKFLGLYTLPSTQVEEEFHEYTLVNGGFPTANLAVRKNVFRDIGGFDETIRISGEDHNLCARIYGAGYTVKAVANAIVHHAHRDHIKGLLRQSFGFGLSHAVNLKKSVSGAVLIAAPFFPITRIRPGRRIWIDFNQADKKSLFILLMGLCWAPLIILLPIYALYLAASISDRAGRRRTPLTAGQALAMALLLLTKSSAMTMGRLSGSFRYRVVCL
jgi:GT2 family glycosyltransferase